MNKIALVGEAWGEHEEREQRPFVGTSGYILKSMLSQVGISFEECFVTNVFNLRPRPGNDVKNLCGAKAEGIRGMPALVKGKYCRAEFAPELSRLYSEIRDVNPNVIVALGATASWALLHSSGIKAIRGASAATHPLVSEQLGRQFKVLPTYHPAAIAREWTIRPVALSDLDKAKAESEFPEVRRPERSIWIKPSLEDLGRFEREYIIPAARLSIDIETKGDQITCIGFAPDPWTAIVIPFYAVGYPGNNYWETRKIELVAWDFVRRWCNMKPAVFQNGLYDIQFLWRRYGITCRRADHDTMLLHHAMQPEMEKGLGFLGTLYTNEASWKFMRKASEQKGHD